jgi:transcriptional regulator with XRE-family HTH domain/ubiquinone/menaquinone biosynthesis C-methylase UbiE
MKPWIMYDKGVPQMIDKTQTGKRITVIRKKLGLSQSALAEKLNVSTQAVSKWECGLAIPDVDLLLELSWLSGIPINHILEGGDNFSKEVYQNPVKLPDQVESILKSKTDRKLIYAIAPYFTDVELLTVARQIVTKTLKPSACITATLAEKQKSTNLDLSELSESTLHEMAPFISEALNLAVEEIPREIKRIAEILICPECGERMLLIQGNGQTEFSCPNNHMAKIVDGVLCFDTREIPGEQWSLSLRNYDHYLEWQNAPRNPNYSRGKTFDEDILKNILQKKPKLFLDIASGMGSGVGSFIEKIDWPCMIILTDLSYRILSWDKIYFETLKANPYVEMVYIACDCAHLPVKTESIDMVVSFTGFESMQHKRMQGFSEANRVLKNGKPAIYTLATVEDKGSANTQKWLELIWNMGWFSRKEMEEQFIDINEWLNLCQKHGYSRTETEKLYGEMPAPVANVFPFENEIMQWMCEYVCVSTK